MENLEQVQEPVTESVDALTKDLVEGDCVQGILKDSFAGSESEARQVAPADDTETLPGVLSTSSCRPPLTAVAVTSVRERAMRINDLPQEETGVAMRSDTTARQDAPALLERLSTGSASRPRGCDCSSAAEGGAVTSWAQTDPADYLPPCELPVSFAYLLWMRLKWLSRDGRGSAGRLGVFLAGCGMVAFCVAIAVVYLVLLLLRATYCKESQRRCRCRDIEAATTDYTLSDAFINAIITHTHFPQALELLECIALHSRTAARAYTQIIAACVNGTDEMMKGLGQSHVRVAEDLMRSPTTPTNRARNTRMAAPTTFNPASDAASDGSNVSNTNSLPRLPEPLAKDLCDFVRDSNVRAMLSGMAIECAEGAHLYLDLLYLQVHLLLSPGLKNFRDVANQRSEGMSEEERQQVEREIGEEAAIDLSAALTLVSSEVDMFIVVSRGEALHPAVRMRLDSFEALLSKGQNAVAAKDVGITRMYQQTKAKNAKASQKARQRETARDEGNKKKTKHEEKQPTAMPVLASEDEDTAAAGAGGGGGPGTSDGRA